MKTRTLVFAASLVALVVSGCALAPEQPKQPPFTGILSIIGTPEEEYVRGMVRAFALDTDITTVYTRLSAGQALDEIRSRRDAPQQTVWWGGSIDGYIDANREDLLQPYKPKSFSTIPRQYKDPDGAWTGIYVGALAIGINRKVLADRGLPEPTSWAELTDPKYKGLVSMAHPATSGTAFTALSTIVQLNGKDVDRGIAYFKALSQNIKEFETQGSAPARLAARGTIAIAVVFPHDVIATNEDIGSSLKTVFPSEGTGYEIGGMGLLKNAPNQDQGKQFMDWALSPKAQELGPLFTAYQIPTNPDAKVPEKSVRLSSVKTIDYDFAWAGAHRQEIIDRFNTAVAPPPK